MIDSCSNAHLGFTRINAWDVDKYIDKKILFYLPSVNKHALGHIRQLCEKYRQFILITKEGEKVFSDLPQDTQFYLIEANQFEASTW